MSDGGDKEAQICGGRMREWESGLHQPMSLSIIQYNYITVPPMSFQIGGDEQLHVTL